jgi:Vitamin K-dependent gamma-carboxylase
VRAVTASRLGDLGIVRVLFGAIVLCRTTPLLAPFHIAFLGPAYPLLGWPAATWHVPMAGVPALPTGIVAALCVARTLAVVLFTVGVRAREAGIAGGLLAWAVLSQDAGAYINTFHLLFLGLIVLGVSGAGSTWAWRPEPEVDRSSGLALTRALVVSVYAWSGFAKLNGSWLRGEVLERLHAGEMVRGPIADKLLTSTAACEAAAWVVVATELALGPLLLWPRTRRAGWLVALAFHATLEITVHPDVFGLAMAVLLLAFVAPEPEGHWGVVTGAGAVGSGGGTQPPARQPPRQ